MTRLRENWTFADDTAAMESSVTLLKNNSKQKQTNKQKLSCDLEQGFKSFVYYVPKKLVAAFQCAQKTGQKKYSGVLLSM